MRNEMWELRLITLMAGVLVEDGFEDMTPLLKAERLLTEIEPYIQKS